MSATHPHLRLHIGPIFDVLVEAADMAAHLFVGLQREGDNWNEAEGEPFPKILLAYNLDNREKRRETDHRFIILPEKLPQFWHCTVRFSAPARGEENAGGYVSVDVALSWRGSLMDGRGWWE